MAVIAFFSAKGAPGTTTAAMLTASLWPRRALLVDCDPVGGDIGLRLLGTDGRPLAVDRGLLTLLPIARRAMHPHVLLEHTQRASGGTEVIVGLGGPEQGMAGGPLWTTLAEAFRGLDGYDVIVDVGRIDSRSPLMPILQAAHVAVCVLGTSVSSVLSTRSRLHSLAPAVVGPGGVAPLLGMVVQAPTGSRDVAGAVSAIQADVPGAEFLGQLATDKTGAGIFDGRPVGRPERTMLVRSGHAVVKTIAALVGPPEQPQFAHAASPTAGPTGGPTVGPTGAPAAGRPTRADRRREQQQRKAQQKAGWRQPGAKAGGP